MQDFQKNDSVGSGDSSVIPTSISQEPLQAALSTAAALAAATALENGPIKVQEQANHRQRSSEQISTLQIPSKTAIMSHAPSLTSQPFLTSQEMPTSANHCIQNAIHQQYTQNQHTTANPQQNRAPLNRQQMFPIVYSPKTPNMITSNGTKNSSDGKSIFDLMNMKLRRGKWTQEEEAYAELLIQEFEKGTVVGCENGCTLRSFLSKKLHCAPMRISKKYAGKSIGKHVFLSRSAGNGTGKQEGSVDNNTKLQDLEMKFYKSLFRESDAAGSLISYLPGHFGGTYPHIIHSGQSVPNSFLPFPCNSQQGQVQPTQIRQPLPWVMQNATPSSTPAASNPLRQTYLSALNQRSIAAPTPIAPAPNQEGKGMNVPISSIINEPSGHLIPANAVGSCSKANVGSFQQSNLNSQVQSHLQPRQQPKEQSLPQQSVLTYSQPGSNTAELQHVENNTSDPMAFSLVHPVTQVYHVDGKALPKQQTIEIYPGFIKDGSHHSQSNNIICAPLEIPDFLSGFEKVATKSVVNVESSTGGLAPSRIPQSVNEKFQSQYSPPFTSRSFDDFHQLLGKGLSPSYLDLNNNMQRGHELNSATSVETSVNDEKNRSVSADSYAMFAHQSALAVSHHSAYSRKAPAEGLPAPSNESNDKNIGGQGPEIPPITTSVVNAANLRAHSLASKTPHIVSGSEKSEWGTSTEETESTGVGYTGSGSDNSSWNSPACDNESDSSESGPLQKKVKLSLETCKQTQTEVKDEFKVLPTC
mmetsp:Transcript_22133/g.32687  ORF Transcript_22133/g.32687 Transcript_22133/m.32687 type:complete len:755 (-) Transcript_22133:498-2762(-)